MSGPSGGDSPLTSPEAILAACRDAVAAAVTVNTEQQGSAGRWMTASQAATANPVGGSPDTL